MEVKEKSKKRELIKTIAIVFLAVLLVLTFFSGTIMNYSLPEVATQLVSSGTINAKIRGSGTLAANESYDVMLDQTREIHSVCVKVGDTVEQGDLLFVLGDVESEELKAAQEALDRARISYQEKVLSYSKDYALDNQTVKTLREDLEKAIKERDENFVTDEEVSFAKGDLAAMEANKRTTDFNISELEALQTENDEYKEAQEDVATLKSEVSSLEKEVEGYENELKDANSSGGLDYDQKYNEAKSAYLEARTKWENDYYANSSVYSKMLDHVKAYYQQTIPTLSLSDSINIGVDEFMRQASYVQTYLENAKPGEEPLEEFTEINLEEENRVHALLLADQNAIDTADKARAQAETDMRNAGQESSNKISTIRTKLNDAQAKLSVAERQLREAQQRLDVASNANTQLKDTINQQKAVQRQQEASITELKNKVTDLEAKQTAYKTASATVDAKQRELENALTGDDIDKQLNNLSLQSMSLDIQKQEELVEKYRKDSTGAEVIAPVSGVISSIGVSAGKKTEPSQPLAVIDVVDRGYTIKISVTNDQAKQVKIGDTAEVTNYYWGNDIAATLEQITADPESGGQKKLLIFRITGDVDAGTNLSLSIGQRSANFDAIVPKSAVREDSNGKFVLIVTSKSTPLGNRYTATRADVQVLAEDDTSAAVSGLASNDYVITTSSKPLSPGSQVRMVENP